MKNIKLAFIRSGNESSHANDYEAGWKFST